MKNCTFITVLLIIGLICGEPFANATGSISGKITTGDGEPVANIWMDAYDQCGMGGNWEGGGITDEQGNFLIDELPEGSYYIVADSSSSEFYDDRWWNDAGGSSLCDDAASVTVTTGQTTSGINMTLIGYGSISGNVTTADGYPAVGLQVSATDQCGGASYGVSQTDNDGNYLITRLPEGTEYYVSTYDENKSYPEKWWNSEGGTTDCTLAGAVTVTTGQTTPEIAMVLDEAGEISGKVTAAGANQPIANIRVQASSQCGEVWHGEGRTDDQGNYSIPGLPPGEYYVSANDEDANYLGKWWNGKTDCNEAAPVTVSIGQTVSGINFTLDEPGKISGSVITSDGSPIPNVQINVTGPCGEIAYGEGTTDEQGLYAVSGLLTGTYYVSTDASCREDEASCDRNYVDAWWTSGEGTTDCSNAESINVTIGQTASGINFILKKPATISGRVTDESNGQSIPNVRVNASGPCGEPWHNMGMTDQDGNYLISGLLTGNYHISTFKGAENSAYIDEWWNNGDGTTDCNEAVEVSVTIGETASNINFALKNGGTISGKVTAMDGSPLKDILVQASSQCSESLYVIAKTDEQGDYALSGLADGEYFLSVDDEAKAHINEWWTSGEGTTNCADAEKITLTAAQTLSEINFSLETGASISGRITDAENDQPLADVCVSAWDRCGETWYGESGKTDSQGLYSITGLPAGDFFISTDASCETEQSYTDVWWNDETGTTECTAAMAINIAAGQVKTGISFALNQGIAISGKVTTASGAPIANVCVNAWSQCMESWYGMGQSDDQGNYAISGLLPGDVYIFTDASCEEQQNYTNKWWNGGTGTTNCEQASILSLASGQTVSGKNFSLDMGAAISGKVTRKSDGNPLPNVCVYAGSQCMATWYAESKTDAQGNYSISGLPSGDVYLFAEASCESDQDYVNLWWKEGDGALDCNDAGPLAVSAGQSLSGINFSLDKGGMISGKVTRADTGDPISGGCVVAFMQCGDAESYADGDTDEAGNYTIPGLPAGSYYISTEASCEKPQHVEDRWWADIGGTSDCGTSAPVTVTAGQTMTDVDFSLEGSCDFTLTIPLKSGWNHISFNILPPDDITPETVLNYPAQNEDIFKTSTGSATYWNGEWLGADIREIDPDVKYKLEVQSQSPGNLEVQGCPVDVSDGIEILAGSNWIAFKPQQSMNVNTALASLNPTDEDTIKDEQNGTSATYFGDIWYGMEEGLQPGKGYVLKSAHADTLIYPESGNSRRRDSKHAKTSPRALPDWCETLPGMQNSMIIYAKVLLNNGTFIESESSILAAFKDGECRGITRIATGPRGKAFQLLVKSNEISESGLVLKAYDYDTQTIYEIQEPFDFAIDEKIGSIADPKILTENDLEGMQNTMTIHARILVDNGFIDTEGSLLAAFKDGECRGVATIAKGSSGEPFHLTLASNETEEPDFLLRAYDMASGESYQLQQSVDFVKDETLGQASAPVICTQISLAPVIASLKALCGLEIGGEAMNVVNAIKEMDEEGKLGLEQVVYLLRKISGI